MSRAELVAFMYSMFLLVEIQVAEANMDIHAACPRKNEEQAIGKLYFFGHSEVL